MREKVIKFVERDENSRNMPGKGVVIECEMDSISRNELTAYQMDICLFNRDE
jgi:hypothetical protein